jgi:predicted outer membrane repeat protein
VGNNHTIGCCGDGGGLNTDDPTAIIDSDFVGYSAGSDGGAIFPNSRSDNSAVINTNFVANTANDRGGAVYTNAKAISVKSHTTLLVFSPVFRVVETVT